MALRMIEVVLPAETDDELAGRAGLIGRWRMSLDDDFDLVRVLVPVTATEAVVNELDTRLGALTGFRLMLYPVGATLPPPVEEGDQTDTSADHSSADDDEEEEEERDPKRIACIELVQQVSSASVVDRIYLVTVLLSTAVAAIGLLRDNVAVVIGAMVIAPLLAPNMTLSMATTLGDRDLARRALRVNGIGVAVAGTAAILIGLLTPVDPRGIEIASRTEVGIGDVVLALAAGSAGALAFTTGLSAALVGVMVAVALLPPLVAAGLLAGSGHWEPAAMALLLTVTNVICVNLAAVVTFLWQGVRPNTWWRATRARHMVRVAAVVWLLLLGLLIALILLAARWHGQAAELPG